ncbi:hypothetical protein CDEF62S_01970 [Castellaniella defragrans]
MVFAVFSLHQLGIVGGHATQLTQKIQVEIGAAELAVGDGLQADVFLEMYGFGDGAVFDLPQGRGVDLASRMAITGFQQIVRPQQAAHVVGTKRRNRSGCHGRSPSSGNGD